MDSDEDLDCPLCMEELDIADRNFRPCTCGYQICRFCWHHIKTNLNGRCPACRREYSEEMVEFQPVSADELSRIRKEKREKERQQKDMESANRRHLSSMRVVQKNLVYIIGLHPRLATEEIVRSHDFFGQFGKISKIVINKKPALPASQMTSQPSAAVYVTYYRKEDAGKAIAAVDGSMIADRVLRASYGTTKYCTYYLRNMTCPNPNCLYLHEQGEDIDTISKEELATGKHHMRDMLSTDEGGESHEDDYATDSHHNHHTPQQRHSTPKLSSADFPPPPASSSKSKVTDDSALPASASWAKIGTSSTPSTPVMAVSDAFGPTLSAAVAASQQKTQFPPMPKRKSEKKKRKELQKQAATPESVNAQLPLTTTEASSYSSSKKTAIAAEEKPEEKEEPVVVQQESKPSLFEQGLTGFVLGQAYRDLCPLPSEEEFQQDKKMSEEDQLTLGVSALLLSDDVVKEQPSPAQRHLEAIQSAAAPSLLPPPPSILEFLTYATPTPPKYTGLFNPFSHMASLGMMATINGGAAVGGGLGLRAVGHVHHQQQQQQQMMMNGPTATNSVLNGLDNSPIRRHSRFGFAQA